MTTAATVKRNGSVTCAAAPQREPPAAAGPCKPLYLDGSVHPLEVGVAGPALAVARGARRMQFPLARLSRVIVRGRVRWDGEALVLCLRQRVPVVFLDSRARPIGAALAMQAQPGALDDLLSDFVQLPDWHSRYENWLRAQRLRILRLWKQHRAALGKPPSGGAWKEAVRSAVYMPDGTAEEVAAGPAYALALMVLARAGVRSQYRGFDGGVLALGADLGRLLSLRIRLHRGTLGEHVLEHQWLLARAFEAQAAQHQEFLVAMLERLRATLGDWVEPWP